MLLLHVTNTIWIDYYELLVDPPHKFCILILPLLTYIAAWTFDYYNSAEYW